MSSSKRMEPYLMASHVSIHIFHRSITATLPPEIDYLQTLV